MALIKDIQGGIETVGELIESLQRFPLDMPLRVGFEDELLVYRLQPQKGECFDDPRGVIELDGDDGTLTS